MPASMFTVIRDPGRDGRPRPQYVSLPLVTSLLEESLKYFVLPPDEPKPPATSELGQCGAAPYHGDCREALLSPSD